MDLNAEEQAEVDGVRRPEVSAPPVIEETESAETSGLQTPPTSEETEVVELAEPEAPPANLVKIDALRRLKALERRGKTVGTHLDELRALLTVLFEMLPD